jgi:hypothetical protein
MARSIAAQQANHLRADPNLIGITADRLMAITPRGYPHHGAARGIVLQRQNAPWLLQLM